MKKYILNIEGNEVPWDEDTIATEQIARLGGWDPMQGVIEIDKDNNERTLAPNEVVHLKPGQGFGKKHKWKRGLLGERMEKELSLLRTQYPLVQHAEAGGEDWFLLPDYPFPEGWRIGDKAVTSAPIVFKIGPAYPTGEPYGFCAPVGINFEGNPPGSPGSAVTPPFDGAWQHFSWAPDACWTPSAEPTKGSNLVTWVRSFAQRLAQGA